MTVVTMTQGAAQSGLWDTDAMGVTSLPSRYWQLINATITSISITYNDGKIQHSFYFATIIIQQIEIIGTFVNGNNIGQ